MTQSVVLPAVVKPVAFKPAESVVVKSAEVFKAPETPKKKQDKKKNAPIAPPPKTKVDNP